MKKPLDKIKTYALPHFANEEKQAVLWSLYQSYSKEYKSHVANYWKDFTSNKLNSFSHLGSTKHIPTKLNASYLQICLFQACATLNNYLANIENKFKALLNKSSITDEFLLHQIRTINLQHDWLSKGQDVFYYPQKTITVVDDYGNVVKEKKLIKFASNYGTETIGCQKIKVVKEAQIIAHKLFKYIEGHRVRFPNLNKPKLLLDSRVVKIEKSKDSSEFAYWLNISTLTQGKTVLIPVKSYDFFEQAQGTISNSIELNFITYPYKKKKEIKFSFFKKYQLQPVDKSVLAIKDKTISFDLGLSTFLATSDGDLLGRSWLKKLMVYDKKITALAQSRQILKLKTRSRRYDNLVQAVRGFVKSETHRILNKYFETNQNIKEVIIEKLSFNNPNLSKRLNRIIKNFGQKLFNDKLVQLSEIYGFTIKELNPAYSSQECRICGFVDKANRTSQKEFKCLCCGHVEHADVHASRINLKRFQESYDLTGGKSSILQKLKERFVVGTNSLTMKGYVSRRRLIELFDRKSSYFFGCTTEAQGVESVTVLDKAVALSNSKLNCNLAVQQ